MDLFGIGGLINRVTHSATSVLSGTTPVSDPASTGRPEPLLSLAGKIGPVLGLATAALTVATSLGILTPKVSGDLNKGVSGAGVLLGLVPGVIAGFAPVVAAHLVATQGRELVTPVSSPQAS
jgi:hypothetical protein